MFIVAAIATTSVMAQLNPREPIPADKDVRIGKLENGMTYYIRHNEKPKGQASFYILHNVGAIQENDTQQGLAHFLEHMAFNGTKNLPGKMLLEYMEKIGVKFGQNLNAATGFDNTTYEIKDIPTSREGIIDTALLVLHDWAQCITLDPKEIDEERGVIMEELRTTDKAGRRASIKGLQTLGKGTRYEHRNLIGYLDYLESFPHQALVDFYHQWYRPDYQAVIIVGDIDVDQIESKIKALMSTIPAAPATASQKENIVVADNEKPIVDIFSDPEIQQTQATIYMKHLATPAEIKGTVYGTMLDAVFTYIVTMTDNRLSEIQMKPNAPFVSAGMYSGPVGVIASMEPTLFQVQTSDGQLSKGLESVYTEAERIRRHGFTAGEFERAQNDMMSYAQRNYTNRNDRTNGSFIDKYLEHYKTNKAIPDATTEWKIDSTLLKMISLNDVNTIAKQLITPVNQVITINYPTKEGVVNPTEADVLDIIARVNAAGDDVIAPYADNTVKEPLIAADVKLKGSPVKTTAQNATMGTTEWTLKNGTKIIIKPTTFKADEVRLQVSAKGGAALLQDAKEANIAINFLSAIRSMSGVSKFSANDLQKQLSGNTATVNSWVNQYQHGLSGNSSPKDLETLMQLVYLNFTAPRFAEEDFAALTTQYAAFLSNMTSNPDYVLQKAVTQTLYGNSPRREVISMEMLQDMKFDRLAAINATLYPDANEFTFTFVGNVNPEVLKPLVEKYIGSIPTSKTKLVSTDDGVRTVSGVVTNDFSTAMQQPKVGIFHAFTGDLAFSVKNNMTLSLLDEALQTRYLKSIREERGGSYSIGVNGNISYEPEQRYQLLIQFDTNEAQSAELMEIVMQEIQQIADNGPKGEDVEKTREFMLKDHKNALEQNGSWVSMLNNYYDKHADYVTDYEKILKSITYTDIQKLAQQILKDNNLVKVIMRPIAAKTAEAK